MPFLPGPPPPFPQGADLLSALEMPLASFGKFSPSLWSASPSLCRGSAQPCSWADLCPCSPGRVAPAEDHALWLPPLPQDQGPEAAAGEWESQAQPCPHLAPLLWLLGCCLRLLCACPVFVLPSSPDLLPSPAHTGSPVPSARTFAFTGPSQSSWPVLSQAALTCLCPLRRCGSALWPWRLSWA